MSRNFRYMARKRTPSSIMRGVIQAFGARNLRMAQDFANIVGGISAEQIMKMKPDEQLLLVEGKNVFCKQARYYSDELFFRILLV